MAIAVSGCIILNEDSARGRMTYQRKCDYCGYLAEKVTTGLVKNQMTNHFNCPKCKQNNTVHIKG